MSGPIDPSAELWRLAYGILPCGHAIRFLEDLDDLDSPCIMCEVETHRNADRPGEDN